jgi:hypothetical protein
MYVCKRYILYMLHLFGNTLGKFKHVVPMLLSWGPWEVVRFVHLMKCLYCSAIGVDKHVLSVGRLIGN